VTDPFTLTAGLNNSVTVSLVDVNDVPKKIKVTYGEDTDSWMKHKVVGKELGKALDTTLPPLYDTNHIERAGWAGYGETGHVVDNNISIKRNKRLGW
jgi:hypothetical protein